MPINDPVDVSNYIINPGFEVYDSTWEMKTKPNPTYREHKYYLPRWLYDAAIEEGLDKRISYWKNIYPYWGTVSPKEELLLRLNNTQQGFKNDDPINWPGRRGFLTPRTY